MQGRRNGIMKHIIRGMFMVMGLSISCSSVSAEIFSVQKMCQVQEKLETLLKEYEAQDIFKDDFQLFWE